jgi:membrane-associated phospholipid phosphatase
MGTDKIWPEVVLTQMETLTTKPWKTWPWILALCILLLAVGLAPPVNRAIRHQDEHAARWLNGLFGHNKTFDVAIARLNSKVGDKCVALCFLLFFFVHSLNGKNREEMRRRIVFWAWAGTLFVLIYQGERVVETFIRRDSPGKALEGWFDLAKTYGIEVKVKNTRCFPSGHAMACYIVAFLALRRYRVAGLLLLLIAIVMPSTRLLIGSHWLSDIIWGAVPLALLAAALCHETRFVQTCAWADGIVAGLLHAVGTRRKRPLRQRIEGAWREFLADAPRDARDRPR